MPSTQSSPGSAVTTKRSTFDSLKFHNYRIWFFAGLLANTGTWMQRIAQDWLVLRVLTEDSATATGITTALQFLPALLFSAHAGLIADRVDQRKLLIATQMIQGLVALAIGLDVVLGHVELWHVYLAAFVAGVAAAYDAPARQTFVAQMVPPEDLANAVGLNSASFNAARLVGPAVAGVVIAWVGPGWVFIINALTFVFPAIALVVMRTSELYEIERAPREKGQLRAGLRYLKQRPDIIVIMVLTSFVSMLTLNYAVTMAAMVRVDFQMESQAYGYASSVFAIGSLAGALWAARRARPRIRTVILGSFFLGLSTVALSLAPTYPIFVALTIPVGLCTLTLLTSANQTVQLSTEPTMRGRVMAIYIMAFLGTTPLGSPLIGWVADQWGPRQAMLVGGVAAVLGALIAFAWGRRHWHLSFRYSTTRPYLRTIWAEEHGHDQP